MKIARLFFMGLCILCALVPVQTVRASTSATMREAIEFYNQGNYENALSRFQQAQVESPDDPAARFNLASAQYQVGNFTEAAKGFEEVVSGASDAALKQKALYNLGNTAYRQGNPQASADFYRKALDLKPSDAEARQNLEFVLQELEKQQQQKKNNKNQKGNEKNKDQQAGEQNKKKDDENKNQQQASKQKQQDSKAGQKENKKEQGASSQASQERKHQDESGELKEAGSGGEQKQGARNDAARANKPDPKALAPEEAERLLNTLSDDQRAFVREQAERFAPRGRGASKDW